MLSALLLLFFACSPVRYVPKGEYLLDRVKIEADSKEVGLSDLKKTVRQHPNTRILGLFRFHLGLYNLSGADGGKRFNKWLRRIGEEPVVYDPFLSSRSVSQLALYLRNKGYYDARVTDTVRFRKRKAEVTYRVEAGPLTRVGNLSFRPDTALVPAACLPSDPAAALLLADSSRTLLRAGMPLDMDLLEQERERITEHFRRNGYYNFTKQSVQFYADTLPPFAPDSAFLALALLRTLPDSNAYRTYTIGNVRVDMDYNPLLAARGGDTLAATIRHGSYEVLCHAGLKIHPRIILESIQFSPGDRYDLQAVSQSYSRLQALNLFKFIDILFTGRETPEGELLLDCDIRLTPMKRQSYNVFVEGTNNSGNIGVGGNFSYNHRNLFHGGENLTLSLWGALKKEKLREDEVFSTTEIGAEVRLVSPQFWLPALRLAEFRRNFAPKTSVSFSFSQEHTQFYKRRVANAKFGYLWRRADGKWNYAFDLVDLNYVMMPVVDREFVDGLRNQFVKSAYTDHMILSANFSAVYTDRAVRQTANSNYFRANVETSGNFLLAMNKLFGTSRTVAGVERYYKILGVRYAQYAKADAEYHFNHYINHANSLVYRFFLGCGLPYGNMKALPFEEAYFCGGANDLRAWQSRTVGPGTYRAPDNYPNSVGDFKLAANVEYRFKLFWLLEGALFLDAGNVWNLKRYTDRPGTHLSRNLFREIAVGTGAGLRVNVSLFLLRFDWGFKLHDPALPLGSRFALFRKGTGISRPVWNIAIGYPF